MAWVYRKYTHDAGLVQLGDIARHQGWVYDLMQTLLRRGNFGMAINHGGNIPTSS